MRSARFAFPKSYFSEMIEAAGGHLQWYNPIRFTTWPRVNNRTHRELLIIDGTVGFIGGAGWADHWYKGDEDNPRWRDTMVRVEGDGRGSAVGIRRKLAGILRRDPDRAGITSRT